MAQSLEFSAQQGLTFTAIARSIGSFSGGTPADSVTHQSGTDRYLATFNTNLSAGSKRLDYFLGGVPFGSEIYDITAENGTFQPRSEVGIATVNAKLQTGQIAIVSPVNQDGSVNSIVIADDYLAANDRAFDFFIDPIAGVSVESLMCYFGGERVHKGKWLVAGTASLQTGKWRLRFELASSDTAQCLPGCYEWSVEARTNAGKRLTRITGEVELIETHTLP